jgi:RHS repeat-associated protein
MVGELDYHDKGAQDTKDCTGMPVWNVTEPYVSLWLNDEPLGYKPGQGPRISLRLSYDQRETSVGYQTNFFGVGKNWNCSWFSYVDQDWNGSNVVHFANGGQSTFLGTNDYSTHTILSGNTNSGFTLLHPDGSKEVYGFIVTNSAGAFTNAFMTEQWNTQSQKTTLAYAGYNPTNPVVQLRFVIDGDGRTNTISYVTGSSSNLISQVVDAFNRTNSYRYDSNGRLTNIVDVGGLSTSFKYDGNNWITNMVTPYGTTTFAFTDSAVTTNPITIPNGRSVLVTEPDGGQHLYLFTNNAAGVASSYSSGQVPATSSFSNSFDNTELNLRNSFHWGPRQYANLSTTNMWAFTASDYKLARMKHWLKSDRTSIEETVSLEREPSPDTTGATAGQMTWYDYAGKTNNAYPGTQSDPMFIAKVLPDGSTSFVRYERNSLGGATNEISTYSAGGSVLLRTNAFVYSADGIDLLQKYDAQGRGVFSAVYTNHQPLTVTDVIGITQFSYNVSWQVTSVTRPSGLQTTSVYFGSGSYAGWLATNIDVDTISGVAQRTNSYTYNKDQVYTQTDERGKVSTFFWDNLGHLTGISDGLGTVTNIYNRLDLVRTLDRMGFTNSYGFDSMRRLTDATNVAGVVTHYEHCNCGALEFVAEAVGTSFVRTNSFTYNNAGRLTGSAFSDGYSVTNGLNLLGQVTSKTDSAGSSETIVYNNQGLPCALSNAWGLVSYAVFDIHDRTVSTTDANGVLRTNVFDVAGRVLMSGTPANSAFISYGYSTNVLGPTSVTDALTNVTQIAYDSYNRETNATSGGMMSGSFVPLTTQSLTYTPAGDKATLTDGNGHVRSWTNDVYGRLVGKADFNGAVFTQGFDADSRRTSLWTPAKGTINYGLDAVGNVTSVTHPSSPNVTVQYDPFNRPTNIVDGVGTTKRSYTLWGSLASEDGPWGDDTVNYTYQNRLRTQMSLSGLTVNYGWDGATKRLMSVSSDAGSFAYNYAAARPTLVAAVQMPNGHYNTNIYDGLARLTDTRFYTAGGAVLNSHSYGLNLGNQRITQTRMGLKYTNSMAYGYDPLGQLTSALGSEVDNTPRLHEQYGYGYDPAGNLTARTNNALVQAFSVNAVDELTGISRSGTLTVSGNTSSPATNVAVNGSSAALYADLSYASPNNTLVDGTNTFTVVAGGPSGGDSQVSAVNMPASTGFGYDLNGNMTWDGEKSFAYDDENQLIRITKTNAFKTDFAYDAFYRMRVRTEATWQSGAWVTNEIVYYVLDGMLTVQERHYNPQMAMSAAQQTVNYTRGLDLSGSLQGAGGIGGLLARTDSAQTSALLKTAFYHADGNGNITALISTTGLIVGWYQYASFGGALEMSGPLASANLMRFSSKEWHGPSRLYYYGLRFYSPDWQRWENQDPSGEWGGLNLYTYVENSPLNYVEPYGLATAVIIGGPSPSGPDNSSGNPFGHASIAFTGNGVYSFGTRTDPGSSLTDFLKKQAGYRDSTVYILNTTPEQEKAMMDYLKKQSPDIQKYPDNCAHRTTEAMKAGGVAPSDLTRMPHSDSFDFGANVNGNWPSLIGKALQDDPGVLQIAVPKGTTLPPNFLTGFNPKPAKP